MIVDDMISTAGTVEAALKAVLAEGARPEPLVVATHGLFVGPAAQRLPALSARRIVTTDSPWPVRFDGACAADGEE
jgi:ribose-phosphate pyrophosphokinase